jgi:uncharacterized protein
MKSYRPLIAVAVCIFASACGSARMNDRESDSLFRQGRYAETAERLQKKMEKEGEDSRDRLLYLLDIGLSHHLAGNFAESNKALLEAEKVADIKDYTSLANETATLLVTDNIKHYKGEDFEKVLVNVYLAMNFALMGNYESALIEARKVNRKLYLMVSEGKRKYKQNAFASYLSGILFESQGEFNDAYVDYKKVRELMPEFKPVGRDLWRMAQALRMPDEMERWDKEYALTAEDHQEAMKTRLGKGKNRKAEIIVLYQNGISPVKRPNPNLPSIPEFHPRSNPVQTAQVTVDNLEAGQPVPLHNIEETAIENLKEKYAGIIAKKLAGAAAKLVVANQIQQRTNNAALGDLARLVMFASDQADCRSWNLLPRDLQLLRVPVEPGPHTVRVVPVGGGAPMEKTIHVDPGKKVFATFRYVP